MNRVTPAACHVMAKPTGAVCNLACDYCFVLKQESLRLREHPFMSEEVLECYIRQTIAAQRVPSATIAWQGGEPTLMGLPFFRRSVAIERQYLKPGFSIENTLQTNGVLIDEEWCHFLRENAFLVGLSLDGPRKLNDAYRHDKVGQPVFDKVDRAARLMQSHGVEFNILCTVNAVNCRQPLAVYRYFRDDLKARHIQFIPIVERDEKPAHQGGASVTDRSVPSKRYGRFLIEIFDEWVRRDVGEVFVQPFEATLFSYVYGQSSQCVFGRTCGENVVMDHAGNLYSCDHFVDRQHLLGNILETPVRELVTAEKQRVFGQAKYESLPRYCRTCEFCFACNGECPKNRLLRTPEGEPGLSWLCEGLKAFYRHVDEPMRFMARELALGRSADSVMKYMAGKRHSS